MLWNVLPLAMIEAKSMHLLKTMVKEHLFNFSVTQPAYLHNDYVD